MFSLGPSCSLSVSTDRRTDRQTNRHLAIYAYASRGKNRSNVLPSVRPSVRTCGVNIFKTIRSETARPTSTKLGTSILWVLGTKLLGSEVLDFGPGAARDHPELSPVGRDDPPERGAYLKSGHILEQRMQSVSRLVKWSVKSVNNLE